MTTFTEVTLNNIGNISEPSPIVTYIPTFLAIIGRFVEIKQGEAWQMCQVQLVSDNTITDIEAETQASVYNNGR